jgi:predicted methyltransferase
LPLVLLALAACSPGGDSPGGSVPDAAPEAASEAAQDSVPLTTETVQTPDPVLQEMVAGDWRKAANRDRDTWRHPAESLSFWGLRPGMTVLEVQPGGGWWTEILAPYAHATDGAYYATAVDLEHPETDDAARQARQRWAARWSDKPEVFGDIQLVNWGPRSAPLPAETFDLALVARSMHGWIRRDQVDKYLTDLFAALKPGGILAVEQHRADPGEQELPPLSGYVTEAYIIDLATKAGFELDASSDINANPADTKDHPFGVWTLPPAARTRPYDEGADATDPDFDRSKYDAIGESDRMTLRFRKPV